MFQTSVQIFFYVLQQPTTGCHWREAVVWPLMVVVRQRTNMTEASSNAASSMRKGVLARLLGLAAIRKRSARQRHRWPGPRLNLGGHDGSDQKRVSKGI